ncbi:hypothetical protein ON010_g6608 [Phytophthora cinnamomi]|nr:hypothetical protein ON010_g6608 [Phytophthora cinnamomi]
MLRPVTYDMIYIVYGIPVQYLKTVEAARHHEAGRPPPPWSSPSSQARLASTPFWCVDAPALAKPLAHHADSGSYPSPWPLISPRGAGTASGRHGSTAECPTSTSSTSARTQLRPASEEACTPARWNGVQWMAECLRSSRLFPEGYAPPRRSLALPWPLTLQLAAQGTPGTNCRRTDPRLAMLRLHAPRPAIIALLAVATLVASVAAQSSGSGSSTSCLISQYLDSVTGECVDYKNQGEKAGADYDQAIDSGNTAWMMMASALVMIMTPGVAFFYAAWPW